MSLSLPPLSDELDLLATPTELETFGEEDLPEAKALLLLQNASTTVRDYCGWRINRSTEVLLLDVYGSSRVWLPSLLVHDVQEVLADGVVLDSASDYSWTANGQLAFTGATIARLQVTVDHGHTVVPPSVRAIVLSLALRAHLNPAAHGSESAAGMQTGYAGGVLQSGGLLGSEEQVLDRRYRIFSRP